MILKENLNEGTMKRAEADYESLCERFNCGDKDFGRQYFHIYTVRLNQMRSTLLNAVKLKWGDVPVWTLAEMAAEPGNRCVIIGTISKLQQLKPSVLKEISEEHQLVPQPPATHYTSPEDSLVLEDETQRIRLKGNIDVKKLVTGLVIALLGKESEDDWFLVEDICFATPVSPAKPLPLLSNDCYVALLSGLNLATKAELLCLQLAADWLTGVGGGEADQSQACSVVRLVIAGGLVDHDRDDEELKELVEAVKLLDKFVYQLAQSMPVDILPGEKDPTNHSLPQQPLLDCILAEASRLRSCQSVSNPYECSVAGRRLLACAGQNIQDLLRVTDDMDDFELLQSTLLWGHIAPTAPDTLTCYPFYEKDPFVIDEQPDIYVAGNAPSFQSSLHSNPTDPGRPCRVVSIPQFSSTKTLVLVNLRTLDCIPINFAHPSP